MNSVKAKKFLGGLWLIASMMLLFKGIRLAGSFSIICVLGPLIGWAKYHFVLKSFIEKYASYYERRNQMSFFRGLIWNEMTMRVVLITMLMILFARSFQVLPLSLSLRALIDLAIGSALLLGSLYLFAHQSKSETHLKNL